jgi:tetratricopeptide (TPR) repeat protein
MDISKYLENADQAVRRRSYAAAIKIYQQLLDVAPDERQARAGLRQALAKKFEGKKVSRVLAMLSGFVPLLSAGVAKMLRNHRGAARSYERYLVYDPFNRRVNHSLGLALERSGANRSAVAVYAFAGEHDATDVFSLKRAGALYYHLKEFDQALDMYEKALAADPRDQEALRARKNLAAEGALKTSRLEKATSSRDLLRDKEGVQAAEKAQRLHRTEDEVRDELAEVEAKLAENPKDLKAATRRAELLELGGKRQEAIVAYEAALALQPQSFDLTVKLGDLRLAIERDKLEQIQKRGDPRQIEAAKAALIEAEVAEYQRRVEAHPTDSALRFQLGAARLASGDVDSAISEFQQSVRDPRQRLDSLVMLGKAFYKKGLLDLSRSQLEKALDSVGAMNQRAKEILYDLGEIAERQDHRDQAAAYYARIYEVDISYRDVAQKVEQLKA